jgi:hypothetical protein
MQSEGAVLAGIGLALTLVVVKTAHSETSMRAANAMLIKLRLCFIVILTFFRKTRLVHLIPLGLILAILPYLVNLKPFWQF